MCGLLLVAPKVVYAQDWKYVKSHDAFFYIGEGYAKTVDEADKLALSDLLSKISLTVRSDYRMTEGETIGTSGDTYTRNIENTVSTFSASTLSNTASYVIKRRPQAHVVRWIRKDEVERIMEDRKERIRGYVNVARESESYGDLDDALRNWYWAFALTQSLLRPSGMTVSDGGAERRLITWIPDRMDTIFDGIKAEVASRSGDGIQLRFTYSGQEVKNLKFSYFDGVKWSSEISVTGGFAHIELASGAPGENIPVRYKYAFRDEAQIDSELSAVLSAVEDISVKGAQRSIRCENVSPVGDIPVTSFAPLSNDTDAVSSETMRLTPDGSKAAIIKLRTSFTGFAFETDGTGIVDVVHNPGEYWIYIPAASRSLTLSNQRKNILGRYDFPLPIEEGRTYLMVLSSEKTTVRAGGRKVEAEASSAHGSVDLGLSVLWADSNVGANTASAVGEYFLRDSGDVAAKVWGGDWRMPTDSEVRELIRACTWRMASRGGVKGYIVTSRRNGASIFLPAAGYTTSESSLYYSGTAGYYWTASKPQDGKSSRLYFNLKGYEDISKGAVSRYYQVRPVRNK